jgi:hypothetical protein
LTDIIWWANLSNSGAEILYKTHLGSALQQFQENDGIVTRTFENGVLVLNNTEKDKKLEITLPKGFKQNQLLDVFDSEKIISVSNGKLFVNVPANKARVFVNNSNLIN